MRARRGGTAIIVIVVLLGLLVAGFFIVDSAARGWAEGEIESRITARLPETIVADPVVTIGGISVIAQYLGGSFESVTVDAPSATVDGTPVGARIVAEGVPADPDLPITRVTGTMTIVQEALDRIIADSGFDENVDVALGDSVVTYEGEVSFFGVDIGYSASAEPVAAGDVVELVPTAVDVISGPVEIDVKTLLGDLANRPIPICVAQYLPEGVTVTDVDVQPTAAVATLEAEGVVLTEFSFDELGSCS